MKYLEIHLIKYVHDLYTENYKTLLRESVMTLINKYAMFMDHKTQYHYEIKTFQIGLWIQYNLYQKYQQEL